MTKPLFDFRWLLFASSLWLAACAPSSTEEASAQLALVDLEGAEHRPLDLAEGELSVLLFITHDCPIANAYAPEIQRIIEAYEDDGLQFWMIHVDSQVERELLVGHAKDYGYGGNVLWDRSHLLVERLEAEVTPEAFILEGKPQGSQLRYRGRIDDRNVAFGKQRVAPGERDLRDALDSLLAGEAPPMTRTKAVGCYIEREEP